MFGHLPELAIVLILGLVFFGPQKLPEIAASAGRMISELRAAMDTAMKPDEEIPDDDEFSTYYYESMRRSGEEEVELEDVPDPADDVEYAEAHEAGGDDAYESQPDGPESDVRHISDPHGPVSA
jgi:TatA/E family protein of Tat protein translocase